MNMAQPDLFIQSEVETITPMKAAMWLEGANLRNRPLNMGRAKVIAAAIVRGEWALNGAAIRFCTNGQLLDGQHRLQAIVLAGQPVRSLVVRGLSPETFHTIDTNCKSRTMSDVMALAGHKSANVTAAAARLAYSYETYGNPYEAKGEKAATVEQVMAMADTPAMRAAINATISFKWCKKYLSMSLVTFAYYAFDKYRPEHADGFFAKLESGIGLEAGSPILLLRDKLMVERGNIMRETQVSKAALLFKCWRLYLLGSNVTKLVNPLALTGRNKTTNQKDLFAMERERDRR